MSLENFRSIDITWDKANQEFYENIRTSSSDARGRKLVVQVLNNGQVEDLTGVALNLYWESRYSKKEGLDAFDVVDANKGIFEIYFTTGMMSNIGVLKAHLQVVDGKGTITSEQFNITVFKGADTNAIESSDSFTALSQALVKINQYQDEIDSIVQDLADQVDNFVAEEEQQLVIEIQQLLAQKETLISEQIALIEQSRANIQTTDTNLNNQASNLISNKTIEIDQMILAKQSKLDELHTAKEQKLDNLHNTEQVRLNGLHDAKQSKLDNLYTTEKAELDALADQVDNFVAEEEQQLVIEIQQLLAQKETLISEQIALIEQSRANIQTTDTNLNNQASNLISNKTIEIDQMILAKQSKLDELHTAKEQKLDNLHNTEQVRLNGLHDAKQSKLDNLYTTEKAELDALEEDYAPKLQGIEAQFNDAIANLTQDSEVIIARTSLTTGKSHESLPTRLDYMESEQINNDKPFHFNHAAQEYLNVDKFFESMKNGKIYTSEFNQHIVSPLSQGTKLDDNAGLIMEPSTNTVAGMDDYSKIGLFMPIDVNAYVDENDDYHVIAIKGDGRFKNDGTMGDVYVMNMVGYQKYIENDDIQRISYSDAMHPGFEVIDEAVKPDGTIRAYLLHAKYAAGRNKHENNNLASISGVYPEYSGMSHNGQIDKFKEKGAQYSGKTSHDDYYAQLIMWLKYATTSSDTVMSGCQSYYLQYENLVAETGVKRVIITNTQANNLLVGSTVSIGDYEGGTKNNDRQASSNYSKANRINILSIENLGDGNSAVYVDSVDNFDTTLTTTITTYPWNSGGCDDVLGVDGSPYNAQSGKEPIIINGIETMVGGRELLQNLIIHNNNIDNRTDVYANYDCKTYATSLTENYKLVGQIATTDNAWKYGSKMKISKNHPSVILITETNASSTTGVGDAIYTNPTSHGGTRGWLSRGYLSVGARSGLRCLCASAGLSDSYWTVLGRLSATGRSRRRAGVN